MENLIVDTKFVMDKVGKPGWVIVDVSFADAYDKGHIPGAVGLPAWVSKLFAEDKKRQTTVHARIEQMFGEMGIGDDSHVIVYGDPANVDWNAVLFWILEAAGCNSAHMKSTVQFYDGGVARWQAEGGTLDQEVARGETNDIQGGNRGQARGQVRRDPAYCRGEEQGDHPRYQDAGRIRRHGRESTQGRSYPAGHQYRFYAELRPCDIRDVSARPVAGSLQRRAEGPAGDHLLPVGSAGLVHLSGSAGPRLHGRGDLPRRLACLRQRPAIHGRGRDLVRLQQDKQCDQYRNSAGGEDRVTGPIKRCFAVI